MTLHPATAARRTFVHFAVLSMLALLILTYTTPRALPMERAGAAPAASQCDQSAAVPPGECAALVDLYSATGGPNWLDRTGWPALASPVAPCDWHGVVCAGGHVVELNLARNRLTGVLPNTLGGLPALARLDLAGNRLQGPVPPGICLLADTVANGDLSYNALLAARSDVRTCLGQLDPDWAATQTVPPREILPATFAADTVQLSWAPIAYTGDGGFYEVSYATAADGPYLTHGQTAGKLASGYLLNSLLPGTTYFVRVQTVTPAHANNPTELRSGYAQTIVVTRAAETILLMVYFPADNDLSAYVPTIVERLRLGSRLNPNVQVVMLADQSGAGDTRVVTIAGGQIQPTDAVFAQWGKRELNTADPAVLAWFLRYARERFPNARDIVSLMGHGLALAPEVVWPETAASSAPAGSAPAAAQGQIPALPKGIDATPGDITDRGYFSTIDLGQALAAATDGGANPFDLIFFDQCFQANLDTLYEVRAAADHFIASPNYAWLVAPYDQYLALLAPSATTAQIGGAIIARYQRNLTDRHPNSIVSLRRADIDTIAGAVSDLGAALQRALRAGGRSAIGGATFGSKYVDTTQCGRQNLTLGPPDELIGAGTFATNLQRVFPAGDGAGVHAAAADLLAALAGVQKTARVGVPYIAPDEFWDYDDTVTILAPLPPNSPAPIVWRSSIYTETTPLAATWTPMPTMTVQITATFAYVRDGLWDEFLAEWYSAPLAPTVGEWCHYIPPTLVESPEAQTLALVAAGTGVSTVRLTWSRAAEEQVAGYWVYIKNAYDIGWVAREIVPPNKLTIELQQLLPGSNYRFLVVAQDATGVTLAQSNEASWKHIRLPVVRR
ncbi:MAG TPA: clostripain-related cysteine peptidase [Roseiflexaceae bacterium]|nr:clostripain-related cysteine peptidase [Roseiflexaceae bacterium]